MPQGSSPELLSNIAKNYIEPEKTCKTTLAQLLTSVTLHFEVPRSLMIKHARLIVAQRRGKLKVKKRGITHHFNAKRR